MLHLGNPRSIGVGIRSTNIIGLFPQPPLQTVFSETIAPESTNVMTASDGKQYWIEYGTPTKVPAVRKGIDTSAGATVDWDGSGGMSGTLV